jgi:hypothetical protein
MDRDKNMLKVAGIPPTLRENLREIARARYGRANASLVVRDLIADCVAKSQAALQMSADDASDTVRVELRLPRVALSRLTELAEERLSPRNYYMVSLLMGSLGQPQLLGDQIEVLRRSNYELSKIGTNLNQLAHAANVLMKGRGGEMPDVGKNLLSLRQEIKRHTNTVLRALNEGSVVWENKPGRGQAHKKGSTT